MQEVDICSLRALVDHLKEGQIVAVFLNPGWHNKKKKSRRESQKGSLFMLTTASDTLKMASFAYFSSNHPKLEQESVV